MLKYDLARLAASPTRRKGTKVLLPPEMASLSAEAKYLRLLRQMLAQLRKAVKDDLLPVVEAELKGQRFVGDAEEGWFDRLADLAKALSRNVSNLVSNILSLESIKHTDNFVKKAKKKLGVDLGAVVRASDNEQYLVNAGLRNAGLIKGLSDDVVKRVQVEVMDAVLQGRTARELRDALTKGFGIADNRAKVIARDQISKLNADLNERRHTQAGVNKYEWSTSADERVRPLHRDLNGKHYEYGKPTGAENGLPPGQPILCRCVALGIVEF